MSLDTTRNNYLVKKIKEENKRATFKRESIELDKKIKRYRSKLQMTPLDVKVIFLKLYTRYIKQLKNKNIQRFQLKVDCIDNIQNERPSKEHAVSVE